ncbi:MAG: glycosyltransferase family 39 protein [bacterium]
MTEKDRISSCRIALALFLISLVAGAFFRLIYLTADPPWDFTWSQALFTDGARVVDGARNKIMFGDWIVDSRSPVLLFYPIMNLVAYLVFLIAGVGLGQANLCGAIFGIASIALIYFCMKRIGGDWAAAISAIMLAFSYSHMVYSRVPMVESLQVFLLILIFFLFMLGGKKSLIAGFLLGISAMMVKLHTIHLLIVVVIYFWARRKWARGSQNDKPKASMELMGFILGLVSSIVLWFVLIYRIDPSAVTKYFKSNVVMSQKSGWTGASLKSFVTVIAASFTDVGSGKDGFFSSFGIVSLCCYLGLLAIFSGLSEKKTKPWEIFAFIWFAVLVASFSFLSYRPNRYFTIWLPSTILVATSLLNRIAEGSSVFSISKPRWFKVFFVVWFLWVAIHIEMDLLHRMIPWGDESVSESPLFEHYVSVWRKILIFLGGGIGLLLVLDKKIETLNWDFGVKTRKLILFSLLIVIAAQGSYSFLKYVTHRKYSLIDSAHSLRRILGKNVFLVGECATTLALETDFRTLPAYGDIIRYGEKEKLEAYPITHFLLRNPLLMEYLIANYKDFEKRALLVKHLVIGGQPSLIVRDPMWPGYEKSGHVPSEFEVGVERAAEGDIEGAIGHLESFLSKHPDSYEALATIALCKARIGEFEEALRRIEEAIGMCKHEEADLYMLKGDILDLMGRRKEALQFWRKAYYLNPWDKSLRIKIAGGVNG